jgi:hypothetical protein
VSSCWWVNHKRKQYLINPDDHRPIGIFWMDRQIRWLPKVDIVGQALFIERTLGLAV